MTFWLRVRLQTTPAQDEQLFALQRAFVGACNALAPLARETGVWSRVGLHQLGYRRMRELYPDLGAQMVCNAVYSVSRTCRLVYQHPASPFNVKRVGRGGLPLLRFSPDAPVYFDNHTLSVKSGKASMFTLDGRIRFNLPLAPVDEKRFREDHLLEIMLTRGADGLALTFTFAQGQAVGDPAAPALAPAPSAPGDAAGLSFPAYLLVVDPDGSTPQPQRGGPVQPPITADAARRRPGDAATA
jgi:hypothetical protein